ncbi:CdaR family transcriptional regulator [Streptomyces sp. PTY087I2]|uniref:PucR family transcriptional regulator n=1 Tax=Streptomyces sp. PTY087I2 TaxID=1819298 RepID=UPI00080BE3D0|nr:helix-turn-helix domain-containing protein [Streptomyces sp. PTY087I2]OCC11473.1 hypothetical protein A3Q37_02670 [Streptomyces sp. PTY087I2]
MNSLETLRSHLEVLARSVADATESSPCLTPDEIDAYRACGNTAAEQGPGMRSTIVAHIAAARLVWASRGVENAVALLEQSVDALAAGYEGAQRSAVRREAAARREFIDDLLYGGVDLECLAKRAERFGLLLSHAHAVAVAGGPAVFDEGGAGLRQVEQAVFQRFGDRHVLLTTKGGHLVCVAPGDRGDVLAHFAKHAHAATDGAQVAVGRPHPGPGGVRHSYEEALAALDLAARMRLDAPVLRAADLLVYSVLLRDRAALSDLVENTLGPLSETRGGAGPLLETLSVFFDAGCVSAEAARRLNLSVRALTYRLERIHRLTGANPAEPGHRYKLQAAVVGARLLNWPDTRG